MTLRRGAVILNAMHKTLATLLTFLAAIVVTGPAFAGKGGGIKPPPPGASVNACGCYRDQGGQCFCPKKGKCVCPGDCEPVGCEEKRQKEAAKEMEAEMKKAAEADKKQRAAEASGESAAPKAEEPKAKADAKGSGKGGGKKDEAPPSDMPALEKKGKKK